MNVKRMRIFYMSLIVIFSGIIITSVYHILGGFEEIKVYKLEPITRTVAGKRFTTHYTDSAPRDFGVRCREMLANGEVKGTLTTITFHSDSLADDEIDLFIGVSLSEEISEIPQDFEVREFTSKSRYVVFLNMHVLVQPRPHKIESMLYARAQEDGLELENHFFELRYQDNSLSVEGWAKE